MTSHRPAFIFLFPLALLLGAGCSDTNNDGNKKVVVCTQSDSTSCAQQKSSCLSPCLADEDCIHNCQLDFCSCLDQANCDPPDECKIDPNTQQDGGATVFEDSGSSVTEDSGSNVEPEDGGVEPLADMPISCPQEDATQCGLDKTTCVAGCVADEDCLRDCQTDFCDCMDWAGCDPPAECLE